VWFKNDPRVFTVTVTGGVMDRTVMDGVVATTQMFAEQIRPLPPAEQEAKLSEIAASVQAGMPPRENPRVNISVDSVHASRPPGRAHCVIHGNSQLQADRPAAGLGGVFAAPAAAAITGGFNVYSAEVEQALMQHPAVRDCAVIGLPDEKWGEQVTAVVEPKPGQDVAADELIAFVKARLGSVKAPKRVELWSELSRSRVGKVLKTEVRAELSAR
jgi:hypothetical protein